MKKAPYSYQEAETICRGLQHLSGPSYTAGVNASIQCIAVAPFDQYNKERFIMYYLLLNDAEAALKEEYDGSLFDVIVLASAADDRLVNESIYTWLLKNNITTAQNVDVLAPISKSNVPVRK